MTLRWRPEDGRSWNLGSITSHGELWLDYLGQQAKVAGMSDLHQRYLDTLAETVPGAQVNKTPKPAAWNLKREGRFLTVKELLADHQREDRWLQAVENFQEGVLKRSHDN